MVTETSDRKMLSLLVTKLVTKNDFCDLVTKIVIEFYVTENWS